MADFILAVALDFPSIFYLIQYVCIHALAESDQGVAWHGLDQAIAPSFVGVYINCGL